METSPPEPRLSPNGSKDANILRAIAGSIRTRIIGGLLLALPIVLTFWIVYWLYATLRGLVLSPMSWLYRQIIGVDPSPFWEQYAAPFIAVFLALSSLYILGLFVRSSLLRAVDWVLLRVPVVTTIYRGLSNVVQSLSNQVENPKFKRVVLVEFPHPGSRALAFVTNSLRDRTTGRTILSVCVLTGVVPPTGFTLFVPEESVTDLNWTVNQTLQAILSGGITTPSTLNYFSENQAATSGVAPVNAAQHPAGPARDFPGPSPS